MLFSESQTAVREGGATARAGVACGAQNVFDPAAARGRLLWIRMFVSK